MGSTTIHSLASFISRLLRRRLVQIALVATTLLIVVLGMAPGWFARSSLVARLLSDVAAPFGGTIAAENLQLGWFSPVEIHGVTINDSDQVLLANISLVRTDRTLLQLAWDYHDLGTIHIERPQIHVRMRPGGSNLEDVLSDLMAGPSASDRFAMRLEVGNGEVELSGPGAANRAHLQSIRAIVELLDSGDARGQFELLQCDVDAGGKRGEVSGAARWHDGRKSTNGSATLACRSVPLNVLDPILTRLSLNASVSGIMDGKVNLGLTGESAGLRATIEELRCRRVAISAPDSIGPGMVRLSHVDLDGECVLSDGKLDVTDVTMESDPLQLKLNGQLPLPDEVDEPFWDTLFATAESSSGEMRVSLDLAALAQSMPLLLGIRPGTAVESGRVEAHLKSTGPPGGRTWTATVESTDLAARRGNQRFVWKSPIHIDVTAAQAKTRWRLDRLDCRSDFLAVSGSGALDKGSITVTCNLKQLADDLKQFVNLDRAGLAGNVRGRLSWNRHPPDRWSVEGRGLLDQLEVVTGPDRVWREPRLSIAFDASGEWNGRFPKRLEQAELQVTADDQRLAIELLEPIDQWDANTPCAIRCRLVGPAERWLARVQPWITTPDIELKGPLDVELLVRASRRKIVLEKGSWRSEPFALASQAVMIDEPMVHADVTGSWNLDSGEWTVADALLQTPTCAFRLIDGRGTAGPAGRKVGGTVTYRLDLANWQKQWRRIEGGAPWKISGEATGQVTLSSDREGNLSAHWSTDVQDAALDSLAHSNTRTVSSSHATPTGNEWVTVWQEPSIKVDGTVQTDPSWSRWRLGRFTLSAADHFQLAGAGTLDEPLTHPVIDVQGTLRYDLATLSERFRAFLPADFHVTGRDTQSFALNGPLSAPSSVVILTSPNGSDLARSRRSERVPRSLTGTAGVVWSAIDLFGIRAGQGSLQARLKEGRVDSDEISMSLSRGAFRVRPHLELNQDPPLLTVDPGKVLDRVQVTAPMCRGWLRYVAPMVANATSAAGTFSLDLQRVAVPLGHYDSSQVEGRLTIHQAHVGPGSIASPMIDVLRQLLSVVAKVGGSPVDRPLPTQLDLPEQRISFRVINGRVYHAGFRVQVGNVLVETQGSVGLDQTLDLVANVPVQPQWIGDARIRTLLQNKTIPIAIRGTINNPRFDARSVEQLGRQLLGDATRDLLQRGVEEGIGRLLGPRR